MMTGRARIAIALRDDGWREACPAAPLLARAAARAALAAPPSSGRKHGFPRSPAAIELSLVLTSDAEQRSLNRRYRGRDAPTNVLSFPIGEAADGHPPGTIPGAPLLLGDVVLARETIAREAAERQKPFADHLRHLVVHGVLHLLGYDHLEDSEARQMEALETAILRQLGVPDPYAETHDRLERT
jgi:probable rRNA maturation factor